MGIQYSFKRYEKKYMLSGRQYENLLPVLKEKMAAERYGLHTVCNVYYDTPDFQLIRASIRKPVYKEKFRVRSYGAPSEDDIVYGEIKKKYKGVVYKRRVAAVSQDLKAFLEEGRPLAGEHQIQREIRWFFQCYDLSPRVYIAYEREAYLGIEEGDLRITLDRNIRWRQDELALQAGSQGELILPEDRILMEIKVAHAAPLWLAEALSREGLFPQSFSKYGTVYTERIMRRHGKELQEEGSAVPQERNVLVC